jgi:hypothetical protein
VCDKPVLAAKFRGREGGCCHKGQPLQAAETTQLPASWHPASHVWLVMHPADPVVACVCTAAPAARRAAPWIQKCMPGCVALGSRLHPVCVCMCQAR